MKQLLLNIVPIFADWIVSSNDLASDDAWLGQRFGHHFVVDDLFEFLSALRNGQAAFSLSTSEKQQNNSWT